MSNLNTSIIKYQLFYDTSLCRNFSCITYLNELQLKSVLCKHHEQIRCYAYAFHDKDTREDGILKEPHFHLVLVTNKLCTISSIRRWFSDFVDCNGDINTVVDKCTDVLKMYDYLTRSSFNIQVQGNFYIKNYCYK